MGSDEVDHWFEHYDNPMREVVLRVREAVLAIDDRIEECIKWKSPTFTFNGNIASFNPRSKKHASLMFHTGKQIPGDHPQLEGEGETAGYMRFREPRGCRCQGRRTALSGHCLVRLEAVDGDSEPTALGKFGATRRCTRNLEASYGCSATISALKKLLR